MEVKLYTDGACSGNPGPGGWACILSTILGNGEPYVVEHSGGYRFTTNNRMEVLAVIKGLQYLNGSHDVIVVSDSKYVCDAFNQRWILSWKELGWRKRNGSLPNADLWKVLYQLVQAQNSVKFMWIKGHNGHKFNERCDKLAVEAYKDIANLQIDDNYEQSQL